MPLIIHHYTYRFSIIPCSVMVDNVVIDFTLLVHTISQQGAVRCSIYHSRTVQCSDRGTPVREEVVVVSRLSMNLKAKLNGLQFWVSDVLGWQRNGDQRVTTHCVIV